MEEACRTGLVRDIGVSNYTVRHLEEMKSYASILPAVNQVELHPLNYISQRPLLEYCATNQIHVDAYSSLGQGELLEHEEVKKIAKVYDVSPAQVLLRWAIQHGFSVIPKTISISRLQENAEVNHFKISTADMVRLDTLGAIEPIKFCWDPEPIR